MATYFAIDDSQLRKLRRMAARLFTEDRMSGDEMRDMAQAIESIVHECRAIPCADDYRNRKDGTK